MLLCIFGCNSPPVVRPPGIIHVVVPTIISLTTFYHEAPSPQLLFRGQSNSIDRSLFALPLIFVPIGSPPFPIRAQALSSNLTTMPSFRCSFFTVRTTIACLMSPLRTLFAVIPPAPGLDSPILRAFWTTTIMRSPGTSQLQKGELSYDPTIPTLACLFMRRLAIHSTIVAPELSMQLSIVWRRSSAKAAETMEVFRSTGEYLELNHRSSILLLSVIDTVEGQ